MRVPLFPVWASRISSGGSSQAAADKLRQIFFTLDRTATVTLTASVTTKAAATITPGTSNQTIAAGTYLTGIQTIAGDADLVGGNILSTANIFGVQGTVVVQNYYTGSSTPSSSTGSNGDLYLQS